CSRSTGNHTANPASSTVNATQPAVIPPPSGPRPNHSRVISLSVPPSPVDTNATVSGTANPRATNTIQSGHQRRSHPGSRLVIAARRLVLLAGGDAGHDPPTGAGQHTRYMHHP